MSTIFLRPYVFVFLAVALFAAQRLIGWRRTWVLFGITWAIAFVCEFASTRIGVPFGSYYYTGSTHGLELYIANIPFMDSLSFSFLLFASYCLALVCLLPWDKVNAKPTRDFVIPAVTPWSVVILASLLFMFIDIVIDPITLRGDRWFLGKIYGYSTPGLYFGVPLTNFAGWMIVGLLSMSAYRFIESRPGILPLLPAPLRPYNLFVGCGLYYGVLAFNLTITFWMGEPLLGLVGCLIYTPITVLAVMKVVGITNGTISPCERSPPQV